LAGKILVENEEEKPKKALYGRAVTWLMAPETTGGKYSCAGIVEVFPGKRALPAHSHPNGEETVYIISGKGQVLIGKEIYDIKEGSIMFFPQGVPHMLGNTGMEVLKGICFYAPGPEAVFCEYHEEIDFPEFLKEAAIEG